MLVLSAAVLVIVIDARDAGRWGWRAGVVDHDRHEFHEKGFGHTRTQRSGARSTLTGRPWGQSIWALGVEALGTEGLGDGALGTGPWGQSINHRGRAPIHKSRALGTEHKSRALLGELSEVTAACPCRRVNVGHPM